MSIVVVLPMTVAHANLISSNVPEDDYAEWTQPTSYTLGQRVIRTTSTTHKVYECVLTHTSGPSTPPETYKTGWVEVSPTNRWKAFDTASSTQTVRNGTISYVLTASAAGSAIGFISAQAISIWLRITSPTGYLRHESTITGATELTQPAWWHYFYTPRRYRRDIVVTDLVIEQGATIEITLYAGTDDAKLGALIMGASSRIGNGIHYGAQVGIRDYSRKETNAFGDALFVRRAYAKRAEFTTWVRAEDADTVLYTLAELRATPALWAGYTGDGYGRTVVYGWLRDWEQRIKYPTVDELVINIEGLT